MPPPPGVGSGLLAAGLAPAAGVLTAIYTAPAAKQTYSAGGSTVQAISCCETSGVATTIRISIAIAGAADAIGQYIIRDLPLAANDTFVWDVPLPIGPTDVVRVYSLSGAVSFNIFGVENL